MAMAAVFALLLGSYALSTVYDDTPRRTFAPGDRRKRSLPPGQIQPAGTDEMYAALAPAVTTTRNLLATVAYV